MEVEVGGRRSVGENGNVMSRIESWGWERQHRLTDKRLAGADGGESEIAHPPPDDQGQDNVHRTKHAHQDKTCLHEVVSSSDIADLIM